MHPEKRTTTSTNDAEQTGNYAFYALDRFLRGAGSAIAQSAYSTDAGVLGCRLNVAGFLPRTTAFPVPFANVLSGAQSTLRVSPVLIAQGASASASSDVLITFGGAGTAGGVSRPLIAAGTTSALGLESAEGFSPYDLVLLSQSAPAATPDCLIEEVASTQGATSPPPLPLGTSAQYPYYTAGPAAASLATLATSTTTFVTGLGNANANDVQYQLLGVGTNNTLYSYDLLQNQALVQNAGAADASQAIADGVIRMNVIYGLATTAAPGIFDHWVAPGPGNGYDINTVMGSEAIMKSIVSVRVGLVVRGEYYDKNPVSPAKLTFFNNLVDGSNNASLQQTVDLTVGGGSLQHYRYRIFEFTVPLRNLLILAGKS